MTINMVSFLKAFGISMIAGALLLSPSSMTSSSHKVSLGQADHLANLNPSTFHHWSHQAVSVAEIDPDTFHHWG